MSAVLSGPAPVERGRSPVVSRAPSMESVDTAGSDQARLRTVRRQMDHANQVSVVTFSKDDKPQSALRSDSRGSVGLWVNSPLRNSPAHNSTGSRKHFESPSNMFKDEVAKGRRHADVPTELRGTAAAVAEPPNAAVAEQATPSRPLKPFVRSVPYYCDSEATPPSNAPNVATPPTGRKRIVAVDHTDITSHSDELCHDREKRMLAPVPGKGNDSHNVINLSEDVTVASPRPCGIRALDGPPPFIPQQLPQRRASPSRYGSEALRSPAASSQQAPSPQTLVLGRGVGLYSPLRQRSELRLLA
jgi:hypothetical protein